MKKFTEVLEQIKEATEEMKHAKQECENATDKYTSLFDGLTFKERLNKRKESDVIKMRETYLNEVAKWENMEINCRLKISILKSNARIALMNDVIDIIITAFNKYSGKPYGEKTREKISNEIKEKTNCSAYIHSDNVISINPVNMVGLEYNIELCMKDYNNKFLVDNKIQKLNKDDIKLASGNNPYIEDIETEVKIIRDMQARIIEKEQELKKMCEEYNNHTVNGIRHITVDCNANRSF